MFSFLLPDYLGDYHGFKPDGSEFEFSLVTKDKLGRGTLPHVNVKIGSSIFEPQGMFFDLKEKFIHFRIELEDAFNGQKTRLKFFLPTFFSNLKSWQKVILEFPGEVSQEFFKFGFNKEV